MKIILFLGLGIISLALLPILASFNSESSVLLIMVIILGISAVAPLFFYLSRPNLSTRTLYILSTVIFLLIIPQQLLLDWLMLGYCWNPGHCSGSFSVVFTILTLVVILPPALLAIKFFRQAEQQKIPRISVLTIVNMVTGITVLMGYFIWHILLLS